MSRYDPTHMPYGIARTVKESLWNAVDKASKDFEPFRKYKSDMGLIPDNIKQSEAYQTVKKRYDSLNKEFHAFMRIYNRVFKKEIRDELKRNKRGAS